MMLRLFLLLLLSTPALAVQRGDVLFAADFESGSLDGWQNNGAGGGEIVTVDGGKAVKVVSPARGTHMLRRTLEVEKLRGYRLIMSARVKADAVQKPPQPWNGVKLMLHTRSPTAGETWTGLDDVHGSFDFKPLARSVPIPPDATEATLFIGLQDAGGTVWFGDVKLAVTAVPRTRPASRPAFTVEPENLRGVMYGSKGKEDDLRTLARWGANHIRWQFLAWEMNKSANQTPEKYARFIDDTIAEVDRWLPLCEELGIRVLIDLHTPPGGHDGTQHLIFADKNHQQTFIDTWDKLATHYKDRPAVWGYDLVNEPVEGGVPEGVMDWRQLAEHVAKRIRRIDPKRAIVVEPGPFGGWDNLPYFEPIDVPGIVYSVHLYEPMLFTHQGVLDGHPTGVRYPGQIGGKHWDRAALEKLLQPVRDYQLDYNVPVYIGEFSAIRWAPGDSAANYLADCISLFEQFGWDWSYHAYREWHGWSLEHGPDKANEKPVAGPNKRREVLLEGFRLNRTAK